MTKAYFFEEKGGWLHTCLFAGVDQKGKAQWVIIDAGIPSMTLEDFEEELGFGELNFLFLCLDGEMADTIVVTQILSASMYRDGIENAQIRLNTLRELGIRWDHKPVEMDCFVKKHINDESNSEYYTLMIEDAGCYNELYIKNFESLELVTEFLDSYFTFLENDACIPIGYKKLSTNKEIREKMTADFVKKFVLIDE